MYQISDLCGWEIDTKQSIYVVFLKMSFCSQKKGYQTALSSNFSSIGICIITST